MKPIIDRLVFGFTPTQEFIDKFDVTVSAEEYKDHFKTSLFADAAYSKNQGKAIEGISFVENVSFKKGAYKNYKVHIRYTPPSSQESILIQIGPKSDSKKSSFMRFDMNPARYNEAAMTEFKGFIEEMLAMPGGTPAYEDFISECCIYRADVAVDVLGARPSDMEVRAMANKQIKLSKSHVYKSATGRSETKYPKVKKGKSADNYFYDKRQELIDTEKEPMYGDFLHSRYECRIGQTTFQKLANVNNRCIRVAVRALNHRKYAKKNTTQKLFVRYALERTVEKALEVIPVNKHAEYKAMYSEVVSNIWEPEKIWSYWKAVVTNSAVMPQVKTVGKFHTG